MVASTTTSPSTKGLSLFRPDLSVGAEAGHLTQLISRRGGFVNVARDVPLASVQRTMGTNSAGRRWRPRAGEGTAESQLPAYLRPRDDSLARSRAFPSWS